jgi:ATP-dependent Zn protease
MVLGKNLIGKVLKKSMALLLINLLANMNSAGALQIVDFLEGINRAALKVVYRALMEPSEDSHGAYRNVGSDGKELQDFLKRSDMGTSINDQSAAPALFKDIVGIDSVLAEVSEIVDYLKASDDYRRLGARMPRGILLEGPPGCGKTMIARAMANEANCNFVHASGSEFIEKYVGTGAARVRELFARARTNHPSIVFIDEFDAIAGVDRSTLSGDGGSMEYKQTINQLLTELDGFTVDDSIIVIAATNDAASLDPAVKRSGRFDRLIHVPLPDEVARKALLVNYLGKLPKLGADITDELKSTIAKDSAGLCAADFKNMVNEMAICAVREKSDAVYARHVCAGSEKVMKQRKSSSKDDYRNLFKR